MLGLLCCTGLAEAAGPVQNIPVPQDTSNARYAADLVGEDGPKRVYAARVLLRRVRTAWRFAVREDTDILTLEARQTLSEFDALVAPRCIRQLTVPDTRRQCARILGLLETKGAIDPLKLEFESAKRRCDRKALLRAIERIEAAS